jgi:hypothetical protein
MGLFNFYKARNSEADHLKFDDFNSQNNESERLIPENIFIEPGEPKEASANTVVAEVLVKNLDHLYTFLDRNLESKGYDDALINPDTFHLEQNIEALRKELLRTIKKVKTFYEDFTREINFHIASRSRSGMIDTVAELTMKKETAVSHFAKVVEIEKEALNRMGDSEGIIVSYTRGFKNGLAAISHHVIINKKF